MQTFGTCLCFDDEARDAARLYVSVFDGSKILRESLYLEGSPGEAGTLMSVEFELGGEYFLALNGGPVFQLSPAISITVHCDTQDEIDHIWGALTANGGEEVQCGWLTDRFGVSWQVVPRELDAMLVSTDRDAAQRAYTAMLSMVKLDIAALESAFAGG